MLGMVVIAALCVGLLGGCDVRDPERADGGAASGFAGGVGGARNNPRGGFPGYPAVAR